MFLRMWEVRCFRRCCVFYAASSNPPTVWGAGQGSLCAWAARGWAGSCCALVRGCGGAAATDSILSFDYTMRRRVCCGFAYCGGRASHVSPLHRRPRRGRETRESPHTLTRPMLMLPCPRVPRIRTSGLSLPCPWTRSLCNLTSSRDRHGARARTHTQGCACIRDARRDATVCR
jgi:hypothetical protein